VKKIKFTLVLFSLLFSFAASAGSHSGTVHQINSYGSNWGNSWSGGILFKLDTMPAGVSYFTIRKEDVAFQTFLAILLSAKHAKASISISYTASQIDVNGYMPTRAITQL